MSDELNAVPPVPPRKTRGSSKADEDAIAAAKAMDAAKANEAAAVPPPVQPPILHKKGSGRFRAQKWHIYHPYQKVTIPSTHTVPLERDNWTEVQLAAGIIVEE